MQAAQSVELPESPNLPKSPELEYGFPWPSVSFVVPIFAFSDP
jgi:hypothetical protein